MISGNHFTDNESMSFQFDKIIKWDDFVDMHEKNYIDAKKYAENTDSRYEFAPGNKEEAIQGYRTVLDLLGDLTGKEIAPYNKIISDTGLKLDNGKVIFPPEMIESVDKIIKAGILPYSTIRDLGGLQLPYIVQVMFIEIVAGANPTLGLTLGCFNLADVIEFFGSEEMKQEWVPKMTSGQYIGSMALTEPNYGSNLPEVQTKAVKDKNGNWHITGSKIFITHACGLGNIESVILTLARSKESSGARGLSFFLVQSKDVEIVRIEEKHGIHCSPTCQVAYDNSPALLIGKEGFGLIKYTMAMMNGARLAIAAQSSGIGNAALREAKKYAGIRKQFGKLIQDIPAVKRLLDNMEMEVIAMRALLYESAYFVDMFRATTEMLKEEGLSEKEISKNKKVSHYNRMCKYLTPTVKFYNSETCIQVASDGLQVFGGSGYTEEYDIASLYRDSRITSIYEGTSQLQVVAAIGSILIGCANKNSFLINYFNQILTEVEGSPKLKKAISQLPGLVEDFKKLNKNIRDERAWDLVLLTAGIINSLLLFRFVRADGATSRYKYLADRYLIEILARIEAAKVKLKA